MITAALTCLRARDNHHPPLNDHRCSKLSRRQQPLRVTRIPAAHTISSATRCSNSKQMQLGSLPISLGWWINEGDEWEIFGLAHKDVSLMKMSKRVNLSRPTYIYRGPKPQGAVGHHYCSCFRSIGHCTVHIGQKSVVSDVSPDDTCTSYLNIAVGTQ